MLMWLTAVMTINLLLQVAVTAARPLTSFRALGLGADGFQLGLLIAGYAVFALIAAVPVGRLIDRYGPRRFMIFGCLLQVVMLAATTFADDVAILIAIQSGIGLALLNANLGMQSTIAGTVNGAMRAAAFGQYSTGAGIGQLGGPALAALLLGLTETTLAGVAPNPEDTDGPFLVIAGITVLALAITLVLPMISPRSERHSHASEREAKPRTRVKAIDILKRPGIGTLFVAGAVFGTSLDLLAIYLPAFGLGRGYSMPDIALLLSVAASGSIGARMLTGSAIRMLGQPRLMILSLMVPAVGFAVLPLIPGEMLFLDMVVIGAGLGVGQPLTLSWVSTLADPFQLTATLGARVSANRVSQLVLPVLTGGIVALTSLDAAFLTLAAILAGTGVVVALGGRISGRGASGT